jgi:rhamnosyltransferase
VTGPPLAAAAAVIVLYDRDVDPTAAVRDALGSVPLVVLVDNAAIGHPAAAAWRADPRVTVLCNANRGGLAGAYNAATAWLREQAPQTELVVFIDDDSDAQVLAAFLHDAQVLALLSRPDTAAVVPAHRDRASGSRAAHMRLTRWRWTMVPREQRGLYRASFVINSMSVWRMDALQRIGAHNEWLGVDHVDTEYCMRAQRLGLAVWVHGDHEFSHSIGQRQSYRFAGRTLHTGGHSPERRAGIGRALGYLVRGSIWREPAFCALCLLRFGYEVLGIVMAERDKARKLASLFRGLANGLIGRGT